MLQYGLSDSKQKRPHNDSEPSSVNDQGEDSETRAQKRFACIGCRTRKVKCVAAAGSNACEYCRSHQIECVASEPTQKRKRQSKQAELKARVEQLEERLSRTIHQQQSPTVGADSTEMHASMSRPRPVGEYYSTSMSPYNAFDRSRTPFSHTKHNASPQSSSTLISPPFHPPPELPPLHRNMYAQTLPPPERMQHMHSDSQSHLNGYITSSPGNGFLASSERHSQRPTSGEHSHLRSDLVHPSVTLYNSNSDSRLGSSELVDHRKRSSIAAIMSATEPSVKDDDAKIPIGEAPLKRLIGPVPYFDRSFYDLCVSRGFATTDDRDCQDGTNFWSRFFQLSKDPALPIYQIQFSNTAPVEKNEIPAEATEQLETWKRTYGDELFEAYRTKIAPRYDPRPPSVVQKLQKSTFLSESPTHICAAYALASQCVGTWSISKRMYLGIVFHRHAMMYLQKDLSVTLDALRMLVLLAEFPLRSGSNLLLGWATAYAFELKLNIDPKDWLISEEEKELRRRIFWTIMVMVRWSSVATGAPGIDQDYYDTEIPAPQCQMDEIKICEVEMTEIFAKIVRSFYTVRSARAIHTNVESSTAISLQLEHTIHCFQRKISAQYPPFETLSNYTTGYALAIMHLSAEAALIMLHRPFFKSSSWNLIESLEHHQKAATSAMNCVAILNRLPPPYFEEAWHGLSKRLLASVAFTLLQESLLSPNERLKHEARESLKSLDALAAQYSHCWISGRYVANVMLTARKLDGDNFGSLGDAGNHGEKPIGIQSQPVLNHSSSDIDWDQLAMAEWDDLSQLFGMPSSHATSDWFGNVNMGF